MIAIATAIAIAMTIAIEGLLGGVSWGGPEGEEKDHIQCTGTAK